MNGENNLETNVTIEDIFCDDGAISKFKENYKERPSQKEAAKMVKTAINNKNIFLLEGETGFGKSFAYLFPAMLDIVESDFTHKVVIVTSGISLQEQLYNKDVPFVAKVLASMFPGVKQNDFRTTLLKGRQNFICNLKTDYLGLDGKIIDSQYKDIANFLKYDKTGDLSRLDFVPSIDILENIACTKKRECIGGQCEFKQDCYYDKHKKSLAFSNVIITNYHMLFSDLKTGGKILPKYDTLIFDEAHEMAGIFRDFDSDKISSTTASYLRNKFSELLNLEPSYKDKIDSDAVNLFMIEYTNVFQNIKSKFYKQIEDKPFLLSDKSDLPDEFFNLDEQLSSITEPIHYLKDRLEEKITYLGEDDVDEKKLLTKQLQVCGDIIEISQSIFMYIENFDNIIADKNNVVWLENINDNLSINLKKVDVGEKIKQNFFESQDLTTIFTSATISTGGNFDYIKEQLGIRLSSKKVMEFIGSSPFNLTEQQLWYLPQGAIDGNKFGFDKSIAPHIADIVEAVGGGTLCLFTSVKNMRNAYYELRSLIGNRYTIYVQNDMPKSKLIEEFKKDRNSILLGTRSFFTGIDVPGDSLRCVVIDKFPFPQPTDPVQQRLQQRDNSFYKYSIPEMIITLKQAIGRGVRDINDKCVVSILDGRMSTARYKIKINNSFPYKKTGTRNIEDVKKFGEQFMIGEEDDDLMPL